MSPTNHLNVPQTEFRVQLDIIVCSLKIDYVIWKSCHYCGWRFVAQIANVFGRCLNRIKKQERFMTKRVLKKRLFRCRRSVKRSVERLTWLVDRLLDASEHTHDNVQKLRQMCASTADSAQRIHYRTWQLSEILEFAEVVSELYEDECKIKAAVVEEITNAKSRKELSTIRQAWRKPQYALTRDFKAVFKQFDLETIEIQFDL